MSLNHPLVECLVNVIPQTLVLNGVDAQLKFKSFLLILRNGKRLSLSIFKWIRKDWINFIGHP